MNEFNSLLLAICAGALIGVAYAVNGYTRKFMEWLERKMKNDKR